MYKPYICENGHITVEKEIPFTLYDECPRCQGITVKMTEENMKNATHLLHQALLAVDGLEAAVTQESGNAILSIKKSPKKPSRGIFSFIPNTFTASGK